jgi:hypothetical protein
MERLHGIIRNLRGLESLWGARGEGRLSLLGVQVNDDRICISEENAFRIIGIRDFAQFWKIRSPITAYRVYRERGEVFVEFEGNRGKIMSYLFVGAFVYHLARVHIITIELEKIAEVLTKEAMELRSHYESQTPVAEKVAQEVEVRETHQEEEEEDEEEPPKKRKRFSAGICRRTEYDPEKMEPYPRCSERRRSKLSEKGLIMFILKDREEEPDSDMDAYLTPTNTPNEYENVHQVHEYENDDIASAFNIRPEN